MAKRERNYVTKRYELYSVVVQSGNHYYNNEKGDRVCLTLEEWEQLDKPNNLNAVIRKVS